MPRASTAVRSFRDALSPAPPDPPGPRVRAAPSGIYAVVMALFCGLLLISNVAATKPITVVDGLPACWAAASSPTAARCCSR